MVWINLFIKRPISAKVFLQSKNESSRFCLFRISVILQLRYRMTLEELSRVSQAMAIQSDLLCFSYRQAGG